MSQENKAYFVQLVKQIVHPYFAEEIADILIAHGMTFKTEPQTNADRIRAMSDEEIAAAISILVRADICLNTDFVACDHCPFEYFCTNCTEGHELEWLKQPAE